MPTLNPDKCYQYIDSSPSSNTRGLTEDELPDNWLKILIEKVATIFTDQATLHDQIEKHINGYSKYKDWRYLKKSLHILYRFVNTIDFSNNANQIIKTTILEGLATGVDECIQGYHDRIERLLIGLDYPYSFAGLISEYRYQIVDKEAMKFSTMLLKFTDDVHAHNYFFNVALQCGYGVRTINVNDPYNSGVSSEKVQTILKNSFDKHYTFFGILNYTKQSLKSRLAFYGYQGCQSSGYTGEIIGNICDLFKRFFNDLSLELLFVNDNKGSIVDVNWRFIEELLIENLVHSDYFYFNSQDRESLFDILSLQYSGFARENESIVPRRNFDDFFVNHLDFVNYLLFSDYISEDSKVKIIMEYLGNSKNTFSMDDLLFFIMSFEDPLMVKVFKRFGTEFFDVLSISKGDYIKLLQTIPLAIFVSFCTAFPSEKLRSILGDAEGLDLVFRSISKQRLMLYVACIPPYVSCSLVQSFFQLFLILRFLPETYKQILIHLIDDNKFEAIGHDVHELFKVIQRITYQSQLYLISKLEHSVHKDKFHNPNIIMSMISALSPFLIPGFVRIIGNKQFIKAFGNYGRLQKRVQQFNLSIDQKQILYSLPECQILKEHFPNKRTSVLRLFTRSLPNVLSNVSKNEARCLAVSKPFYNRGMMR